MGAQVQEVLRRVLGPALRCELRRRAATAAAAAAAAAVLTIRIIAGQALLRSVIVPERALGLARDPRYLAQLGSRGIIGRREKLPVDAFLAVPGLDRAGAALVDLARGALKA